MAQLLNLCKTVTNSDANFTWVPSDFILKHKIEPWTELPIWISPEMYGFYGFDASKAMAAGLTCRPMSETVSDTWKSINTEVQPELPAGRVAPGLSKEKELAVLAAWAKQS